MRTSLTAFLLLASFLGASAPNAQSDGPRPPEWVEEEMAGMIGRWIADNGAYQGEEEPYEAYGVEWSWGIGETSVVGCLFGLHDGEEVGPFWEFRWFWHPGEARVMVYQFGWGGVVGIGSLEREDEHTTRLLQTFFNPSGPSWQSGHRTERRGNEEHGVSFDVSEDGTWIENRSYLWIRQD